jgi:hypothetical protein
MYTTYLYMLVYNKYLVFNMHGMNGNVTLGSNLFWNIILILL